MLNRKSVCRLVEILVGPVLLAGLLEIYKIVITRTRKCRFSYIYIIYIYIYIYIVYKRLKC